MSKLSYFLSALLVVLSINISANAQITSPELFDVQQGVDFEFGEEPFQKRPVASSGESENLLRFFLKKGSTIDLAYEPDVEEMKKSLGLALDEEARKQIEASGQQVPEVDPLADYNKLSEPQKQNFQRTRLQFLNSIVHILEAMDGFVGAGLVVNDSLKFVKKSLSVFKGKSNSATQASVKNSTFSERKKAKIQAMVRAIDYKLWAQAPLVIEANEFGLQVAVGAIGLSGSQKKGFGGVEEVGLAVAYNKSARAFVFEVFHSSEKFESSMLPVLNIGVNGKAGFMMVSRDAAMPTQEIHGHAFYPPGVPGFSGYGSRMFVAGASSGLGFPPPPLADVLTFMNTFDRNSLIRVTVSPFQKGFVRIYVGDVKRSVKLVVYKFSDIYNAIRNNAFKSRARSCQQVFSM